MYDPQAQYSELCVLPQDVPLDPAVERVRKKLMRLMIISISITLLLILAVFAGVIYKIIKPETMPQLPHPVSSQSDISLTPHYTLSFPPKTQILSQSLSDQNIVLRLLTPKGQTKFMIYNYHTGALLSVFSVNITEETTNSPSLQ
ncbi:conserved protein of unknown function [Bartonella clarridgeiae 73]|uniref:Fimbrial subunit PilA n=1 Tax=Bartonella clarridgeiae (strain CCUG 45776 / CIP 104772 / 73) TaxID=696125 RepID=E6YIZ8_BARC7|nr:hypothetical protein [Bartonella clarridgeiae]WCR55936.1 MAG: putative fimbrial subunit PilA [Bartonella clarridgeiae]CBI76836.1 conserved protein of unknown function [Bartonella clarridgeiae 73]